VARTSVRVFRFVRRGARDVHGVLELLADAEDDALAERAEVSLRAVLDDDRVRAEPADVDGRRRRLGVLGLELLVDGGECGEEVERRPVRADVRLERREEFGREVLPEVAFDRRPVVAAHLGDDAERVRELAVGVVRHREVELRVDIGALQDVVPDAVAHVLADVALE
jgi:hypothetical protein